jgi:hypothetical protein
MSGVSKKLWNVEWRQGMRVLLVGAALVLFVAGDLVPGIAGQEAEAGQPATPTSDQADPQRLVGRWVRPDGGYILELREVAKEGSLKAAYFNPRPINVARAEWSRKDGALTVFVELRDVNYPGSTYTLQYDPASDRLKGAYFQAVEKQTFAVEFARTR